MNPPPQVGQTFVRLEKDFDTHVHFYQHLPETLKLLEEREDVKAFFQVGTWKSVFNMARKASSRNNLLQSPHVWLFGKKGNSFNTYDFPATLGQVWFGSLLLAAPQICS